MLGYLCARYLSQLVGIEYQRTTGLWRRGPCDHYEGLNLVDTLAKSMDEPTIDGIICKYTKHPIYCDLEKKGKAISAEVFEHIKATK